MILNYPANPNPSLHSTSPIFNRTRFFTASKGSVDRIPARRVRTMQSARDLPGEVRT